MRKTIVLLSLVFVFAISNITIFADAKDSPIAKGRWLIKTDTSIETANGSGDFDYDTTDITIGCNYFLDNNIALGLDFVSSSSSINGSSEDVQGINPSITLCADFSPPASYESAKGRSFGFLQVGLLDLSGTTDGVSFTGTGTFFGIGFIHMISDSVGLGVAIRQSNTTISSGGASASGSSMSMGLGFIISLY